MRTRITLISSILLALLFAQTVLASDLVLVDAKVYLSPTDPPIENATIVIHNGRITAVGSSATTKPPHFARAVTVIDCKGMVVTAGFWNSHVHFTEPKWENAASLPAAQLAEQLQGMLTRYGFTSVVDTGSLLPNTLAIRKRIESGELAGPRIFTAGSPLYPKDGIPYYVIESVPPDVLKLMYQPATPEEAIRAVDDLVADGADIIKLFVVSWIRRDGKITPLHMQLPIVQAAADEAHRKGKLVFAHPSTIEGVELVLQGHVDVLAHTTEDPDQWNAALVKRLKSANVSLIPTLTLFSGENGPDAAHEGILREVKSYTDAGGKILFGTDVGYLTDYNELTREFGLLSRAGLSSQQILASLTTNPAQRFGYSTRSGRIAKGMDADLVVLSADPTRDVTAFFKVAFTIRRGKILFGKP